MGSQYNKKVVDVFRYDALNRSLYYEHMKIWLKFFPLSQFHVVNGDRLIKKPWHEVIRVEKFLGVDHQVRSFQEALKAFSLQRPQFAS